MNLFVDLILESERRSASVINPKMVVRVLSVSVPIIIAILLAIQALYVGQLRRDLATVKLSRDSAGMQQNRARDLIKEFQSHRAIQEELSGWTNSRVAWHENLGVLMTVVPTNVQLRALNVGQTLQLREDQVPLRLFTLNLGGRAVGSGAEPSVRTLEDALRSTPPYSSMVTNLTVPLYGADTTAGAQRDDRVFEISCQFFPRAFQ